MEERREGRALPAGRDVRVAEAVDRVDAEPRGDARAGAELAGETPLGPMQDRLAVQPDQRDGRGGDRMVAQEGLDGAGMRVADRVVLVLQGLAAGALGSGGEREQGRAQGGRIGIGAPGAGAQRPVAIGLHEGDVDAVHRRAADHPDRAQHGRPDSSRGPATRRDVARN